MEIEESLLGFFLFLFLPVMTVFQMGNNQFTSPQMPLRCILDNWKLFDPLTPLHDHGIRWGTRNTDLRMRV